MWDLPIVKECIVHFQFKIHLFASFFFFNIYIGTTTPDQKEPTPFIIEWIPDILPKSHIGELRIKLEYGHQRNGQIEHRVWSPPTEIPIQTIHVQEIGWGRFIFSSATFTLLKDVLDGG